MMNFHRQFKRQAGQEDGVAILLAVMLVSAMAIISSTVAFFVVQEVRNARSSALTEPAIVAAETAGEQGIYQFKRGTFDSDCDETGYTRIDGTTTAGGTNTAIKKCIASQPAVLQIVEGSPLTIWLYDPLDIQGNTCLEQICPDPAIPVPDADGQGGGLQLYDSLVVRSLSGTANGSIDVDIRTFDDVAYDSGLVPAGDTVTFPIQSDILGSSDERLEITLTASSGTVTAEVSTTSAIPGYSGLPDYQTVDAEGCVSTNNITSCDTDFETYRRRINITLPR